MARQAVYDNWIAFNAKDEGSLNYMYVDQKNLVTTGMGDLIDPIGVALQLPWKRSDGSPASQSEIADAWNTVKNSGMQGSGGGRQGGLTTLRLTNADVQNLIDSKLEQMESVLNARFPSWQSWPADAQMGLLSMAWAMGPSFKYPKFEAAANQAIPDFVTMAAESFIPSLGSGDGGRNADDNTAFTNAANVLAMNADPNTLFWPGVVTATIKRTLIGVIGGFLLGGLGLLAFDWLKPDIKKALK